MTLRQIYEAVLIEMNKVEAPSLLLEDFNYLANKAINQYINKKYNIYDVNQQSTDDLRVLKATVLLEPHKVLPHASKGVVTAFNSLQGATYETELPTDYLHILNCICIYKVKKTFKCYNAGDYWQHAATRLTADAWSQIINNWYMRPSYRKPYYFINNVNTNEYTGSNGQTYNSPSIATNPLSSHVERDGSNNWDGGLGRGTDVVTTTIKEEFDRFCKEQDLNKESLPTDSLKDDIYIVFPKDRVSQHYIKRSYLLKSFLSKKIYRIPNVIPNQIRIIQQFSEDQVCHQLHLELFRPQSILPYLLL